MITPLGIGLVGLLVGLGLGAAVQRARLCTFGAVEDALMGHDWRRMKVFGLALALAILGTQALVAFEIVDPLRTTYIPARMPILGLVFGGLLFGLGMALVGTCGFGSLVRLGTGDLRALVVLLVFAITAYATLRGLLSDFRIRIVEAIAIPLPGPSASDLATQVSRILGRNMQVVVASIIALPLIWIAARDRRLRRTPRLVLAGIGLGLGVPLGWLITGGWNDPFDLHTRVQSLTFVAPVARAVFGVAAGQDSVVDFGVASVVGVALGAALASLFAREFRWEAFDDQREMRRHITGGALMGFGGVLAGGCTIGQGLTAGSLLAISMPITILAMIVGARLGIAIIVGEIRDGFDRLLGR